MTLRESVEQALKTAQVSVPDFSELLIRLLDSGVLCRDESQTEQILYDRFARLEPLVRDYLALMGISVLHDTRFHYVRIYPPGADTPGLGDAPDTPPATGLRARLSPHEVALVLVLRAQYERALREGDLDDDGCVWLTYEGLTLALRNLLGRSLPESRSERRALFASLRRLRLIRYNAEEWMENPGSHLRIRPLIVTFVSDDILATLEGARDDSDEGRERSASADQQEDEDVR
ncbi:MAG: DUF4194 domain-containing protein [Gammaproteobacteria bacterium]|nr:MAG: DUF4194 domain-containing protein [Gammaproteobacteria bacterium]